MAEVSSAEVQRNFGVYRERAEGLHGAPEAVTVLHYNKPSVVIISAEEYDRLKRRDVPAMIAAESQSAYILDDAKASAPPRAPRRIGFMAGEIAVPDDFDRMGEAEIEQLFGLGN